jgi:DNA primase
MQSETLLSLIGTGFKRVGREHHGPCFKCGGSDRFIVFADGTAWCRQCQWKGDAIQLLRDRDGLSFKEAADQVGKSLPEQKKTHKSTRRVTPALHASVPKEVEFDQSKWGAMAHKLMKRAMNMLSTDDDGKDAESYLMDERGLSLAVLCGSFLGFIPKEFETVWGGLNVKVERGISIPWFDEKQIVHKLNVRTDNPAMRYKMVTGSVNGAYMLYRVRQSDIVVLTEGEFDALSVMSATNYKACGVATGSTMGGRLLSVVARLALARRVLVAFDTDQPGEDAAQWWLQALPNAKRLAPLRHDVNDMLVNDGPESIIDWIRSGLDKPVPKPAPIPQPISAPPVGLPKKVIMPGMPTESAYHRAGM